MVTAYIRMEPGASQMRGASIRPAPQVQLITGDSEVLECSVKLLNESGSESLWNATDAFEGPTTVAFSDGIAIFEGLKVMVGGARGGAKHFQLRFIVHARGEPQGEALATVDSIKFFGGSSTTVAPAMSRPTGKSFSG